MESFLQTITDNIGAIATVLGSSVALQTAISILVAIILKVRNSKAIEAQMAVLQSRSAMEFETKLERVKKELLIDFTTTLVNAIGLLHHRLREEMSNENNTSLVGINAYIETILSSEGNEQLRIDYERINASLAKSARRVSDDFDEKLLALLNESKTAPVTEEVADVENKSSEPEKAAEAAIVPEPKGEEVTEYDV